MDDFKLWVYFLVTAGIVIISTTYIGCNYALQERELFVKGGYYECTLAGSRNTHWCK